MPAMAHMGHALAPEVGGDGVTHGIVIEPMSPLTALIDG